MDKLNTKKQIAHAKWRKAVKTAQNAVDALILCANPSETGFWEKREAHWNQKAREYRAIYLLTV